MLNITNGHKFPMLSLAKTRLHLTSILTGLRPHIIKFKRTTQVYRYRYISPLPLQQTSNRPVFVSLTSLFFLLFIFSHLLPLLLLSLPVCLVVEVSVTLFGLSGAFTGKRIQLRPRSTERVGTPSRPASLF